MPRAKRVEVMNRPASAGNRNAVGNVSKRKGSDREQAARLRADRTLNLAVPECVAALRRIVNHPDSTNMDIIAAAREILDRKIPKKTQADIALEGMPGVTIKIPGLNWPALSGDPAVTVKSIAPRQAVLEALKDEASGA